MSNSVIRNKHLIRSNSSALWHILKFTLIIHLCLLSLLQTTNSYAANQVCDLAINMKCKTGGKCISKAFLCDGENDCGDFSDEEGCPSFNHQEGNEEESSNNNGCDADSFQCMDGLCIPNHWVCDGSKDCMDNSDETLGCNNTIPCDDGFRCKSRTCIPKEWKCDGNNDCGDNSDEENCPIYDPSTCNINSHHFLCVDRKKCITLEHVCDGLPDCIDSTDEGGQCLVPKNCSPVCTNGHVCFKTPLKSLCVCPSGFSDQQGFCKDIDECKEFGACDHKCVNSFGSFTCSCAKGFHLLSDKKSCKADGGEGLLLFSSEHEIRAFFLDSKVYYPISKNISQANGIAYDGHHVYWSNIGEDMESIVRAKEDGSDVEEIVNFGLGTPENLALDWITGNIYFTDSQMQHIGVCTKTGMYCAILHKDGVDNPRAIAVDPQQGMLYWSDWGQNIRSIIKSGMDGSGRKNVVVTDIHWPNGITIDFGTGRLYWADASKKRIESILLDGSDRRIIVSEPVDHPFSITVFEDKLYWSDLKGNQILSCNKFNGKNQTAIIKKHDSQIYNLYIFHSSVQSMTDKNPCLLRKCSHLCLLSPQTWRTNETVCACPQDMQLSSDGKTCVLNHHFDAIYAAVGNIVTQIKYNKIGKKHFEEHTLNDIGVLGDITYNAYSDSIIMSDLYKHRITSFSRVTKTHTTIYESNNDLFLKLDHDPIANNLYWINGKNYSLNVMSLTTSEKTVLIPNFSDDLPTDFVLIPDMGIMFVSLHSTNGHCHIDKYNMDGTSRYHFIEKELVGPIVTLAYDSHLSRLFYADQGAGQIISTSLTNLDKHVFRKNLPGPVGLTAHGDYLFWVNFGSDKIYWANKYNGQAIDIKTNLGREGVDTIKLLSLESFENINNSTCHDRNGGCSHICLLKGESQVCVCPFGMTLDKSSNKCEIKVICSQDQYMCASGECIRKDMVCNNVQDCQSGDDESNCLVVKENSHAVEHKPSCPLENFFCHDNSGCLPLTSVCNSISECLDDSDEWHCSSSLTCSEAQFTCDSGECIPATFRCDDRLDCLDGSDEGNCKSNTCNPITEFRCNSGNCIPLTWQCDKELDCPDASDEHANCDGYERCKKDMFACLNHKCIDKKLECNSFDDCGDNSDEIECSTDEISVLIEDIDSSTEHRSIYMCNITHFTCSGLSGLCIPLIARCNGSSECTFSEDEVDCNECIYGHFECTKIKECIPQNWVCDGMIDCDDKSDEDENVCMHKENEDELAVKHESVPCVGMECQDSKKCIPLIKVCDQIPDCDDHSDEHGLCGFGCDGASCSQKCRESPLGAQCECYDGYVLANDGRSCHDINECSSQSVCSQHCHNTVGSFYCSCFTPYYQLRDDRRRCKATGKEMEIVYLTRKDIRLTTESFSTIQVLYEFSSPTIVNGMDINSKEGLLYWTSRYEGKITKLSINNPDNIIIREGLENVGSIAVDWVTGNVYVVINSNIIHVCDEDVITCVEIYKGSSDIKITAIVLDPLNSYLFWSEMRDVLGHSVTCLKRSLTTGRQVETMLNEEASILAVSDMTYDVINKWLYFTDLLGKKVGRIYYNGTKLEVLFVVTEPPNNIGLFEDHLYLSVKRTKSSQSSKSTKRGVIHKCGIYFNSLGECNYVKLLPSNSKDDITGLKLSHLSLQIEGHNYCDKSNCEGICVNAGKKAICLCERGILAPPDGSCPNLVHISYVAQNEMESAGTGHTTAIVCSVLILFTVSAILIATKYNKLTIPSDYYGHLSSRLKQFTGLKFKGYKNKSFQFDNLKNELTEDLLPEVDEYNNPHIRTF